jgi:hypothetical protein
MAELHTGGLMSAGINLLSLSDAYRKYPVSFTKVGSVATANGDDLIVETGSGTSKLSITPSFGEKLVIIFIWYANEVSVPGTIEDPGGTFRQIVASDIEETVGFTKIFSSTQAPSMNNIVFGVTAYARIFTSAETITNPSYLIRTQMANSSNMYVEAWVVDINDGTKFTGTNAAPLKDITSEAYCVTTSTNPTFVFPTNEIVFPNKQPSDIPITILMSQYEKNVSNAVTPPDIFTKTPARMSSSGDGSLAPATLTDSIGYFGSQVWMIAADTEDITSKDMIVKASPVVSGEHLAVSLCTFLIGRG